MEKTMRITKAMRYEDIIALLSGSELKHGTTPEDAIKFIEHEIELLSQKKGTKSKKPTKVQEENEGYKALILDFLAGVDSASCSDIINNCEAFRGFSNQKVSALMRQLRLAGLVDSSEYKGKTYFSLMGSEPVSENEPTALFED